MGDGGWVLLQVVRKWVCKFRTWMGIRMGCGWRSLDWVGRFFEDVRCRGFLLPSVGIGWSVR